MTKLVWGRRQPVVQQPAVVQGPFLVTRTTTTLTVAITANMGVQAWMEYGTSLSLGAETTHETSYLSAHTQVISGLTAGTTYFVRAHVVNQAGQHTVTSTQTFQTLNAQSGTTLQAIIDGTSPGGSVDISGLTFTTGAIANKAITLIGDGTGLIPFASGAQGLRVTANGVVLSDLVFRGPGASVAYNINSRGIDVRGTSSARISGFEAHGCTITESNGYGMYVNYANAAVIESNLITDILYTGIGMLSDLDSEVRANTVRRIADRGIYPSANAIYNGYGIYASQADPSVDIYSDGTVIDGNTVSDVPTWHGLDTHGGRNMTWTNNHVSRCNRPIWVGSDTGYVPINHVVSGNLLDQPTPRPDATNSPYNIYGISVLAGASGVTGTGNTFNGFPLGYHVTSPSGGGFYGPHSITGHTILNPI